MLGEDKRSISSIKSRWGGSHKLSFASAHFITGKVTNSSVALLNAFSEGQNEHTLSCIISILLSNLQILCFFIFSREQMKA